MSDAFGTLFEINEAGTTITIVTAGVFVKWITSSAGLAGPTDLVQVDVANDQFVIGANGAGDYQFIISVSFEGNTNSLKEGAIFVNGVRQQMMEMNRHIGASMDAGAAPITGTLALVAGDIVDLRFTADGNGDTVILFHVNFHLHAMVRSTA